MYYSYRYLTYAFVGRTFFFEMVWNCIHPVWPGVFNMVNVVGKYDFMAWCVQFRVWSFATKVWCRISNMTSKSWSRYAVMIHYCSFSATNLLGLIVCIVVFITKIYVFRHQLRLLSSHLTVKWLFLFCGNVIDYYFCKPIY